MSLQDLVDSAFVPLNVAVKEQRIPGAVLGVVNALGERAIRYTGLAQRFPIERSMQESTWFDLASLTKVLFTTPRILAHHEAGLFLLDDPLIKILPDLQQYDSNSWIRKITFAQCLTHQSGLPAVEPIYTYGQDENLLGAFVLQRNWKPSRNVYSDINFILLGLALERIEGKRIRQMEPGQGFAFQAEPSKSAATEDCTWRGRVLCGDVHDDNCHALKGAGHAGLFGTAAATLQYACNLLTGSGVSMQTIQAIRSPVSSTRTYGWERMYEGWSGGDQCSKATIGHIGFTGTGLWIDFDKGLAWTVLTNRIHPTRHIDSGIETLRRDVAHLLYA